MVGRIARAALPAALLALVACSPDLGPADAVAASEIVYDSSGVPAFAGQAITIQSCGAGGFCHADEVDELVDRYGAPADLSFDVRLASITIDREQDEAERLFRAVTHVQTYRGYLWDEVSARRMPPGGDAGAQYREQVADLRYERFSDAGEPIGPLPTIDSDEGREIFRNWLATLADRAQNGQQALVVERTLAFLGSGTNSVGYTVASCERGCVDPTWQSIYAQIVAPSCARSRCHDDSDPAAGLDLWADVEGVPPAQVGERIAPIVDRLLGATAQGEECRAEGARMLVAGEPGSSLLYLKVAAASSADVCGNRMPIAGNPLTAQRLCAIREWIECGACAPGDPSCDACTEVARTTCGVRLDPDGAPRCAMETPCPNRVEL